MATYQCKVCGGTYLDPQEDGSRYFHRCARLPNPAYLAQFALDEKGNTVPKGKIDITIARTVERPGARDENVEMKPSGHAGPKNDGTGKNTL